MRVELKNVSFSERMSEETNAFVADIYVNGKKSGYAKNDGRGGCTDVQPWGGVNRDLFTDCEKWLKTQPQLNIGTEKDPYMVNCDMESMVDYLFQKWLKEKDEKKMSKKMETSLMWGKPNDTRYTIVNYKQKLSDIPRNILQDRINYYKKSFKEGEVFLNTNLVGFEL